MTTTNVRVNRGGTPERILDLLDIDGGWWTTAAVAHRLDVAPATAQQALYRLTRKGLLRSRPVNGEEAEGAFRPLMEWRTP